MLNELAVRDPWETMWLSSFRTKIGVPDQLMGDEYTSEMRAFDVRIENLERLKLCEVERTDQDLSRLAHELEVRLSSSQPTIRITAFGRAFVAACTPPTDQAAYPERS